ncbi:VWA domain-containing protein [Solirubrobacter sp. CPCC 204708]|uniref:VWA domain-containing protein n=1 Tax=Solirubrobacter deserti TaxID=2282478 RepID=A0ABT4RHD8_9ACTN|nr:VWA domain-containing protein [Solirubrobacter deserti]MBE2315268.1 VWA domain-containing protein [Solirubrobacter deserti]MDA0137952.1 VWA domain-containing protein [Solirubrobacter deserti]
MPSGPRIASGHGQIAEQARENVARRERARVADEATIARAASVTDFAPLADHLSGRVSAVAQQLRAHGARVGMGEVLAAQRALAAVDATDRTEVFFALRAALCSTRAEMSAFASAFTAVFGAEEARDALDELGEIAKQALPRVGIPPQGDEAPGAELLPAPAAWSEEELLREKDFAAYTDAERAVARRLLMRIALRGPTRRSRRTVPTRRRRETHDLRATIRASLRTGGELLERRYREQAERPRRLVLVCDVSGSMAPYSRMLLQYMQACVAARARVEAFVFGTRLTRVTRELRGRDSDRALARAAAAVDDWSGGTRIGEAIAVLNREHGRRIGRGSVVILLSDGWDRGEPEELAEEMARLQRTAHRVIWLNPLAADPRYEPLTRGMKAAMPHVDRLLPGNSIASLETLAALMEAEVS